MKVNGCQCYTWKGTIEFHTGLFRDAEGSWWIKYPNGEFGRIYYCPYCGKHLLFDSEKAVGDLNDWKPPAKGNDKETGNSYPFDYFLYCPKCSHKFDITQYLIDRRKAACPSEKTTRQREK